MADMESQPLYDVVILGASGFTGKYVIREALKFLNVPSSPLKTLALAGRNPNRVTEALHWAAKPNPPPTNIPILAADTSDPDSLRRICAAARVILNCVGPFRLYGEAVVEACVATGTDYLDICGEPEFMERTEAKFHGAAAESGALVVSACGFDSVPAEIGVMFNSRQWIGPAVPNRVEAYLSLESEKEIVLNVATYESAVLGYSNADRLMEFRRSRPKRSKPVIPGPMPRVPEYSIIEHQKAIGLWVINLPSADSTIVQRTFSTLTNNPKGLPGKDESPKQIKTREAFWSIIKPMHFDVKIGAKSESIIQRVVLVGVFIAMFGKTVHGKLLLLTFPSLFGLGFFRRSGPTEEEVNAATFKMWFIGHGFSDKDLISKGNSRPDMEIVTRLSGPDPGYLTTSIIMVQCAIILLSQRENFPKGGVFTPGIIFGPTDLQRRLEDNGISFDVVSKSVIPGCSRL